MLSKPKNVFDRVHEWQELVQFCTSTSPGLQIGIVRGRRRHGKSFLLEHICRAVNGVYTLALQQSRSMALDRFSDALSGSLGYRIGRFASWVEALDTAVDALGRRSSPQVPLLVLDELPYLTAHSAELPSALQALYDQRGPSTGHAPFRIILCGSAVSVMSTLLAGNHALRGRAVIDMRIGPFDYRSSAEYWRCPPQTAVLVDAVLGGAPGYRDLIGDAPESGPDGLYAWLERTVCNPSHILFSEPDYLLAEDPKLGNRAIYHAIWEAVALGATTPTQVGGLVGVEARSLSYHLTFMRDAGFIRYDQDILLQRHPVITVADPVVRFHNLIVRPNLMDFELRAGRAVWERVQDTFSSKILGPHFEDLARGWTRRYAHEVGINNVGPTGTTVVACKEHRGHEVDVLAFAHGSRPRDRKAPIVLLGEAKSTNQPRTVADLHRLEHIRDLLAHLGWNVTDASFALFSRTGFTTELTHVALNPGNRPRKLHLLDLDSMYAS